MESQSQVLYMEIHKTLYNAAWKALRFVIHLDDSNKQHDKDTREREAQDTVLQERLQECLQESLQERLQERLQKCLQKFLQESVQKSLQECYAYWNSFVDRYPEARQQRPTTPQEYFNRLSPVVKLKFLASVPGQKLQEALLDQTEDLFAEIAGTLCVAFKKAIDFEKEFRLHDSNEQHDEDIRASEAQDTVRKIDKVLQESLPECYTCWNSFTYVT
ncbi:hypothetical protein V2G26_007224 [Clonostachys chloroleuca]